MSAIHNRRAFLKSTCKTAAACGAVPYWFTGAAALANEYRAKNDRPLVGVIASGSRAATLRSTSSEFGDIAAVCDVSLERAEKASLELGGKPRVYQDYRKLLEQKDLEIIINATPEHWHTLITVDACKSGRDVFTEKPLCLTIDEGKLLGKVVQETGRVVQVGSQQRSREEFRLAVELVHSGRIGKLKRVYAIVPFHSTQGGPFASQPVPQRLDWDLWQGQAPLRPYCPERFNKFRGWDEYGGGIITDWGQHQLDVAFWGMKMDESGPLSVEGKAIFPNGGKPDCYNNLDRFLAKLLFPGDLEVLFFAAKDPEHDRTFAAGGDQPDLLADAGIAPRDMKMNGIMFIGETGRIFVNRGGVRGVGADEAKKKMTGADGNTLHMKNFFDCVKSRQEPICPVRTAVRVINACLLTNVAVRAGRTIHWDVEKEAIVGDAQANNSPYVRREQRAAYKLPV